MESFSTSLPCPLKKSSLNPWDLASVCKTTLPNPSDFLKDKTFIIIKAFECIKLGSDAK